MKIHVTQEDIDKGTRYSAFDCPISCAISRATGYRLYGPYPGEEPIATACSGHIRIGGVMFRSAEAATFANDFDDQKPVYPCVIKLTRV